MKCETTNTVLTFILGALALLGVIFALQTIFRTREYTTLNLNLLRYNNALIRVQSLANDTLAYTQRTPSPDLTRILQSVQAKPATR